MRNIVCIGDSITFGTGSSDADTKSYPALLQKKVPSNFRVRNFGLPGRAAQKKDILSYYKEPEFKNVTTQFNKSDVAIFMLGTNDAARWNETAYVEDYTNFVNILQQKYGRVYLMIPPPIYRGFSQLGWL